MRSQLNFVVFSSLCSLWTASYMLSPVREVLFSPFYNWKDWGSEIHKKYLNDLPKIPQAVSGRMGTWIQVFLTWKSVFFQAVLLATSKSQLLWMLHMFIPACCLLYFRNTFYIYLVLFYLGGTSTASWNLMVTTTWEGRGYIFDIPILKTSKLRLRSV